MDRKTALITGASSGIGRALAALFGADGYDLIVTARRAGRLRDLGQQLEARHKVVVHRIELDLAQPGAGRFLWKSVTEAVPAVDALVNNAGIGDWGPFAEDSPTDIEQMILLNVAALTALTRDALPGMIQRGHGRILQVASLAGFQPGGPNMAVYFATKSYVLSLSRALRRELRGTGVTVTALCPGPTTTEFADAAKARLARLRGPLQSEEVAHLSELPLFTVLGTMSAESVARAGYDGMRRGHDVVVPGVLNKLLAVCGRCSPPAAALEINRYLLV